MVLGIREYLSLLITKDLRYEGESPCHWGKAERLAKTAAAFANAKGGIIVVGTDDDHHVVGCQSMGLADTVTNILHSHCDPPPSITIEAVPSTVLDSRGAVARRSSHGEGIGAVHPGKCYQQGTNQP